MLFLRMTPAPKLLEAKFPNLLPQRRSLFRSDGSSSEQAEGSQQISSPRSNQLFPKQIATVFAIYLNQNEDSLAIRQF